MRNILKCKQFHIKQKVENKTENNYLGQQSQPILQCACRTPNLIVFSFHQMIGLQSVKLHGNSSSFFAALEPLLS